MTSFLAALVVLCALSSSAVAQVLSSGPVERSEGALTTSFHISQAVPYRVFTLDAPMRLVLDFQGVTEAELQPEPLTAAGEITAVTWGTYRPGTLRVVAELAVPFKVEQVALRPSDTGANLSVTLRETSVTDFAAATGAAFNAAWDLPKAQSQPEPAQNKRFTIVLDPGHGGIDPGAQAGGVSEKELILEFANDIRDALIAADDIDVHLTRTDDYFVSLNRRVGLAHQVGADAFVSLHADALAEGRAHGATVYVLSDDASDAATERLVGNHDRAELLSGVDLGDADDEVAHVLLEIARQETEPHARGLANALVEAMGQTGGPMNRRPLRAGGFSVLKSADIPSVLIEVGFLSSPRDLANLKDRAWRIGMAKGVARGILNWKSEHALRKLLVRQ